MVPCSSQQLRLANMTNIPLTTSLLAQKTVHLGNLFESMYFLQLKASNQKTNALDMMQNKRRTF